MASAPSYTHFLNLAHDTAPPEDGILSRTIYQDDQIKTVVFGFGVGQELSEHTSSRPAVIYFVQGEGTVGLGDDKLDFQPGTFVHMPEQLKHSVQARTPTVMLLILLRKDG